MKCIIGLGNIGEEYINTRHNTGFMCIDYLCKEYGVVINKNKKKSIYGETCLRKKNGEVEKIVFVKPTTYMNLSGESVLEMMNWFKLDIKDILIIYDDIDIPFKEVRYRSSGSSGTHNGMRNIISIIKNENIDRIRVGIENRKNRQEIILVDYVLGKYSKEELSEINGSVLLKVKEIFEDYLNK